MRRTAALIAAAALLAAPLTIVPLDEAKATNMALQLFNLGCHIGRTSINGCFITSAKSPIAPGGPGIGTKEGRACGWNILALFTWGDLRITTAMADGGITDITSVDSSAFEFIPGFYGINHYCTVVSGN